MSALLHRIQQRKLLKIVCCPTLFTCEKMTKSCPVLVPPYRNLESKRKTGSLSFPACTWSRAQKRSSECRAGAIYRHSSALTRSPALKSYGSIKKYHPATTTATNHQPSSTSVRVLHTQKFNRWRGTSGQTALTHLPQKSPCKQCRTYKRTLSTECSASLSEVRNCSVYLSMYFQKGRCRTSRSGRAPIYQSFVLIYTVTTL